MSPNFRIAFRFLTAKKLRMLMSLLCIVLGVGMFVITQATTSGFQGFFISTILGTDGALRIQDKLQSTINSIEAEGYGSPFEIQLEDRKFIEGIDYPQELIDRLMTFSNVKAVSEVLHGTNVTLRSSFKEDLIQVFGVNLDDQLNVSDLGNQIVEGSLADFRMDADGALMGRLMADRAHLHVGSTFQLQAGEQPRRYKVSAIYETGVSDIDKVNLYLKMEQARSLLKKPTGASYLQVSLYHPERAKEDAAWMTDVLGHSVAAWQDRQSEWLGVFHALSISTGISVSIFILIAGLAMFSTLLMIVMEKTKDIAILRSMGYTRRDISQIFLWQAAIVLVIGAFLGCLCGAAGTYAVSQVPLPIHTIFKTDKFLVSWNPWHYVEAVGISIGFVMVASLVPSRRAARLEPGDIIRGTAQ